MSESYFKPLYKKVQYIAVHVLPLQKDVGLNVTFVCSYMTYTDSLELCKSILRPFLGRVSYFSQSAWLGAEYITQGIYFVYNNFFGQVVKACLPLLCRLTHVDLSTLIYHTLCKTAFKVISLGHHTI